MGWMVAKAETKKQNDTNSRVYSGHKVYMYQRVNILLQGLERCGPTVGAISDPTAKLEPSFGAILPVMDLHGQ